MKVEVDVPDEIKDMAKGLKKANPSMDKEQAIRAIANSEWAKHWAKAMCGLGGRTPTPECVENLSERLAREVYHKA